MDDYVDSMAGWEPCLINMLVTYVDTKMNVRRRLQQIFLLSSVLSTTPAGQPICKEKRSSELFFKNKNKTIEIVWEFPRSSDG